MAQSAMVVLIDADPIVYRCGFAAERTSWHLVYETIQGEADEIEFSPTEDASAGDQMRDWLAFNEGRITVLDKSRVVRPDPVSYALRATKVQIESIMAECEAKFGPSRMLMWISAGRNYRDKIATVRPYKGNRDPTHKPYHYGAIRDYLCSQYSAFVARGIEADDAVSIYAHNLLATGGSSYVVATIDKDLDQIPGNHYNYMNKVHYAITEQESERWFIYQLLAGDTTDNIVGVWKCGPTQAVRLLAGLQLEPAVVTGRRNQSPVCRTGATAAGSSGTSAAPSAGDAPVSDTGRQLRVSGDTGEDAQRTSGGGYDNHTGSPEVRGAGGSDRAGGVAGSDGAGAGNDTAREGEPEWPDEQGDVAGLIAATAKQTRTPQRISPPWWGDVVRAYADSQRKPGCPYAKDNPEAVAIEMAQLVKLQEYPGQLWHPHGDLVVPGFGEENFDG